MTAASGTFHPNRQPQLYLPTSNARSRWGDDHLNGPAWSGSAARTLEDQFGLDEFIACAAQRSTLFKAARAYRTTTVFARLVRDGRLGAQSECDIVQEGSR